MDVNRTVPLVDWDSAPFWEKLKEGKFMLMECSECHHVFFPARIICPECWSSALVWREASGNGVIYSFTTVEAGATAAFELLTPYTIALITLEEGCRVFGMLRHGAERTPAIGAQVRCDFEIDSNSGFVFPVFGLV